MLADASKQVMIYRDFALRHKKVVRRCGENGDLETTEVASHLKFFDIECGLASIATNWVIHSLGVKLLQPNPVFVFALSDLKYSTFVSSLTPHMYIYREHIPPRFLAPPDVVGFWFLFVGLYAVCAAIELYQSHLF